MEERYILDIQGVSKSYPGTLALDNVNIKIKKGEVHAICGENGAGKSTLMNILAGIFPPDKGEIYFEDKQIESFNFKHMQELGISIVYQERSLVSTMSVADNVFPERHIKNKLGFVNKKQTYKKTTEILKKLKEDIKPNTILEKISPAKQQMVEIAKALSVDAKVLILDEPTAAITSSETQTLFEVIKELKDKGMSIVYISHRLAEVFEIADRVSILKDGKYVSTKKVSETNIDEIVVDMVGRSLDEVQANPHLQDEILLEVRNLTSTKFRNLSFNVKKGEILTLTGLSGAGRTEAAMAIFGADSKAKGEVFLDGNKVNTSNVAKAIKAGFGYIPEDRKEYGLFLDFSIFENVVSASVDDIAHNGIYNRNKFIRIAKQYKQKLNIVAPSVSKKVIQLSGGNQQKVVLAKWLMVNPKLLIMDEPTRGVDVGAKAEIYNLMLEFVETGKSILVISSDMSEAMSISDRVIVMANGELAGELNRDELDEELILKYAAGLII